MEFRAVLVAIAIPIFTSQLEKSREAADISNIRSAYGEAMASAVAGDTEETAPEGVDVSDSTYTVTTPPAQSTGAFEKADTSAATEYMSLPASVTKGKPFSVAVTVDDSGKATTTVTQE